MRFLARTYIRALVVASAWQRVLAARDTLQFLNDSESSEAAIVAPRGEQTAEATPEALQNMGMVELVLDEANVSQCASGFQRRIRAKLPPDVVINPDGMSTVDRSKKRERDAGASAAKGRAKSKDKDTSKQEKPTVFMFIMKSTEIGIFITDRASLGGLAVGLRIDAENEQPQPPRDSKSLTSVRASAKTMKMPQLYLVLPEKPALNSPSVKSVAREKKVLEVAEEVMRELNKDGTFEGTMGFIHRPSPPPVAAPQKLWLLPDGTFCAYRYAYKLPDGSDPGAQAAAAAEGTAAEGQQGLGKRPHLDSSSAGDDNANKRLRTSGGSGDM